MCLVASWDVAGASIMTKARLTRFFDSYGDVFSISIPPGKKIAFVILKASPEEEEELLQDPFTDRNGEQPQVLFDISGANLWIRRNTSQLTVF